MTIFELHVTLANPRRCRVIGTDCLVLTAASFVVWPHSLCGLRWAFNSVADPLGLAVGSVGDRSSSHGCRSSVASASEGTRG